MVGKSAHLPLQHAARCSCKFSLFNEAVRVDKKWQRYIYRSTIIANSAITPCVLLVVGVNNNQT